MRRYEKGGIIMTTNRPLEDWGQVLGDTAAAGAILDRFLHRGGQATREKLPDVQPKGTAEQTTGGNLDGTHKMRYLLGYLPPGPFWVSRDMYAKAAPTSPRIKDRLRR